MTKKAYLVTFVTTTRVTVDVPEDFDVHDCNLILEEHKNAWDSIVKEARENILENPEGLAYTIYINISIRKFNCYLLSATNFSNDLCEFCRFHSYLNLTFFNVY